MDRLTVVRSAAVVVGMAGLAGAAIGQSKPMLTPTGKGDSNSQVRVGPAGGGARAVVGGAGRIEKYAKVLGLDAAQTAAAKDLYEAYQRDTREAAKKMQDSMRSAQDDMDAGDRKEFEKGVQKTMADHAASSEKLTSQFLGDLKSLLRPEQVEKWPALERLRRREQYLSAMMSMGGAAVGGASVNLMPIVEKLKVPEEAKGKLAEVMGMYEMDLDRPLKERQQNFEDERKTMGAVQTFDAASFEKKTERDRKVDLAIRDVNLKYVGLIQAALPENVAKEFADNYQVKAFRTIYRESSVAKKMAAAEKVAGLTDEQKARLRAAQEAYKAEARKANDRWAAAQQKAETEGRSTGGGGLLVMGPGMTGNEKVDPAVAEAKAPRKAVDDAAKQKLEGILTAEQMEAIPKPVMRGGGGKTVAVFGDGSGEDMVFVDDVDLGDDVPPGDGGGATVIIRTVTVPGVHGGTEDVKVKKGD